MATESLPLELWLQETGALKSGHFRLSSGLHSPAYVQCALLLEEPRRAQRLGAAIAERLRHLRLDSVLAPAMGGLIIGYQVAAALDVPFRFVERVDGDMRLRRGFSLKERESIVIVEDVVTTGKSTQETVAVAEAMGAEVCAVSSILDRTEGKHPFRVPFVALYELVLPTYSPSECPLCAADQPLEKPGSRPVP